MMQTKKIGNQKGYVSGRSILFDVMGYIYKRFSQKVCCYCWVRHSFGNGISCIRKKNEGKTFSNYISTCEKHIKIPCVLRNIAQGMKWSP